MANKKLTFKETSSLDTKSAVQFREFFNLYFLFISSPVLQALKDQVIKECVVGPRHVAFLLEVSNTEFSIKKNDLAGSCLLQRHQHPVFFPPT